MARIAKESYTPYKSDNKGEGETIDLSDDNGKIRK